MSNDQARRSFTFGPDYPAVLTDSDGTKMELVKEGRWSRVYRHPVSGACLWIPRFLDGTANVSVDEVSRGWGTWSVEDREDFCLSLNYAPESLKGELPDIVRLIVGQTEATHRDTIAIVLPRVLPAQEAYDVLCAALAVAEPGRSPNIVAAIAETRHPLASKTLISYLLQLPSQRPAPEASGIDGRAVAAVNTLRVIARLGNLSSECEHAMRSILAESNDATRAFCEARLTKLYPDGLR